MTTEEFFKRGKPSPTQQQVKPQAKPQPKQNTIDEDIVIPYGVRMVAPKKNGNFLRLTDKTIININDIILVNVETLQDGSERYRLFLEGKHMTLRLSREDYNFIDQCLMDDACGKDEE